MKPIKLLTIAVASILATSLLAQNNDDSVPIGKDWDTAYSPRWESLKNIPIPEWMLDAKFGIYTHWGIYSVPAHGGPDYIKGLYKADVKDDVKGVQEYHVNKYGPVSEFGYKDFVPMFTAPKFDADEWAGVMAGSGAKFGGICLSHHDGFCLWDSKYTTWDAKDMGPKKDIYGEIAKAVRAKDMKLVATFHMARTYGYPFDNQSKYSKEQLESYDIFDDQYGHMYRNSDKLSKEDFGREWAGKVKEVVDNYSPDVIWFDGLRSSMSNKVILEDTVLDFLEYYYESASGKNQEVVVCNKLPASKVWNFPLGFGLRCYENCRDMEKAPQGYWLADRAIGYPWSYVNDKQYGDREDYHVRSLVDMVSRGGIFFLSLTPKGDGSIPDDEKEIMKGIGDWLKVYGEAIYATRRWNIPAEGPAEMHVITPDDKLKWDFSKLGSQDVRYTRSKDRRNLYATVLGIPESGKYTLKSLAKGKELSKGDITDISMIGSDQKIKWKRGKGGLTIYFPEGEGNEIATPFKITFSDELILE